MVLIKSFILGGVVIFGDLWLIVGFELSDSFCDWLIEWLVFCKGEGELGFGLISFLFILFVILGVVGEVLLGVLDKLDLYKNV